MIYALTFFGVVLVANVIMTIFIAYHFHFANKDRDKTIAKLHVQLMEQRDAVVALGKRKVPGAFSLARPKVIEGPMTIYRDGQEALVKVQIRPSKME